MLVSWFIDLKQQNVDNINDGQYYYFSSLPQSKDTLQTLSKFNTRLGVYRTRASNLCAKKPPKTLASTCVVDFIFYRTKKKKDSITRTNFYSRGMRWKKNQTHVRADSNFFQNLLVIKRFFLLSPSISHDDRRSIIINSTFISQHIAFYLFIFLFSLVKHERCLRVPYHNSHNTRSTFEVRSPTGTTHPRAIDDRGWAGRISRWLRVRVYTGILNFFFLFGRTWLRQVSSTTSDGKLRSKFDLLIFRFVGKVLFRKSVR